MTRFLFTVAVSFIAWISSFNVNAQNVAPFWSLSGNSNANNASKLGTTNNVPLRLLTNNIERIRIDPAGKVGIGTTAPTGKLTVFGSGSIPAASWVTSGIPVFAGLGENLAGNADHILAMASNLSNARAVFLGRKARGTLAAPAAVQVNDYLLSLFASGYDGSSFQSPATVDFFVDGVVGPGSVPTRVSLSTGSNFGNRTERLKINANGNVDINNGQLYVRNGTGYTGLGTNAPANRLHVRQNIPNKAIEMQHETQTDFWTVGIGTNTLNYRFEFNGTLRGQISSVDGSFIQGSDRRLKEDIEPMQQLLDKVLLLKPSTYYYKDSRSMAKHRSIGFIAQEVEEVFPELVYDEDGGNKMLNYPAFAVVAIKVIQEQEGKIAELEQRAAVIDSLKTELQSLREMVLEIRDGSGGTIDKISGYLEPTAVSSGNGLTTFRYHIGDAASNAKLMITNSSGQIIKTLVLNNRGTGQVNFDTNSLAAGIYNYTLYVNWKRVDSKRLVIAR